MRAIVVLFLFVIMLRLEQEQPSPVLTWQRPAGIVLGSAMVVLLSMPSRCKAPPTLGYPTRFGSPDGRRLLFQDTWSHSKATSILLLAADGLVRSS